MIEIKKVKAKARETLEHNLFGNIWIMLLLVSLICSVVGNIPFVGFILIGVVQYALARMYIKAARGNKVVDFEDLICGAKEDLTQTILLGVLRTVFVFLWSLLLIVPGIIKSYAYSMASYIQQDSEDKDWRSCLDRSIEMMKGYKWKLFVLDLSFIGWYIVGFLCLGVGVLWVSVYHEMARAHFYEELKALKCAPSASASASDPAPADDSVLILGEGKISDPVEKSEGEDKE